MSEGSAKHGLARVYIGGLVKDIVKETVESWFSNVGPIRNVHLPLDDEKACKGFALVDFTSKDDAESAIAQFNGSTLDGCTLVVEDGSPEARREKKKNLREQRLGIQKRKDVAEAKRLEEERKERLKAKDLRLILRNLPWSVTEEKIRKFFKDFGNLTEVKIPIGHEGKLRGFAFVTLEELNRTPKAVRDLNGKVMDHRKIAIDYTLPKETWETQQRMAKEEQEAKMEAAAPVETAVDTDEAEKTEKSDDAPKKKSKRDIKDEAIKASSEKRKKHEEAVEASKSRRTQDVEEGRTLFCRNVAFDATDFQVRNAFEVYGEITSCLLVTDHAGNNKGTAFVEFATSEAADAAVEAAGGQQGNMASELKNKMGMGNMYTAGFSAGDSMGITINGRRLAVMKALSRREATKASEDSKEKVKTSDKRNIYLRREGLIDPESEAGKQMSKNDLAKRESIKKDTITKLKSTNFFISPVRLTVFNVPFTWTTDDLKKCFMKAAVADRKENKRKGQTVIKQCKVEVTRETGKSKGFGFVEFVDHEDAMGALRKLNNNPETFTPTRRPIICFSVENVLKLRIHLQKTQKSVDKAKITSTTSATTSEEKEESKTRRGKRSEEGKKKRKDDKKEKKDVKVDDTRSEAEIKAAKAAKKLKREAFEQKKKEKKEKKKEIKAVEKAKAEAKVEAKAPAQKEKTKGSRRDKRAARQASTEPAKKKDLRFLSVKKDKAKKGGKRK